MQTHRLFKPRPDDPLEHTTFGGYSVFDELANCFRRQRIPHSSFDSVGHSIVLECPLDHCICEKLLRGQGYHDPAERPH